MANCAGCYKTGCGCLGQSYAKQADAILDSFRGYETVKAEPTNQMYQSMKATFSKCLSICERKSNDYSVGANPYRNFEGSPRVGVPVQKGLVIRLQDKFSRLENLIDSPAMVKDESFEDTIDDAINYLAILKARREYERNSK